MALNFTRSVFALSLPSRVLSARAVVRSASTLSLLPTLFRSCQSCGVKLQNKDASMPGFYIQPQHKKRFIRKEDAMFQKLMSGLSIENKRLLLNDENIQDTEVEALQTKNESEPPVDTTRVECVRCRDAKYRSKYNIEEYPIYSFDSIITTIPPHGKIVYIISAQDFPFSVNRAIFNYRSPHEMKFVINKADLLFSRFGLANRYGLKFFQDFLKRKYNVPPENVIIASGLQNWNVKNLVAFVDDYSYFVGNVNCGKSTIIGSLLYYIEKNRPKHLSSRDKIKLEKEQDRSINKKVTRKVMKRAKMQEDIFRLKNAPGVSFVPGFTRDHIEYSLLDKTIYDVPGFTNLESHGTLERVDHHVMKQLSKGTKVSNKGFYYSAYETFKGGQCLSAGGLFYLQFPEESMFQIRNCINLTLSKFSSLEKAWQLLENIHTNNAVKNCFVVEPSTLAGIREYIIPPFYGPVDLVIKNVGHINVTPTGSKKHNEPLRLYLPQGVDAIIRQPITRYIAKSPSGRDAKGNPLKKENWSSKSVMDLKRYTGSEPFYSLLIPASKDPQKDTFANISEYVSHAKGTPVDYTASTVLEHSNKYVFWCDL